MNRADEILSFYNIIPKWTPIKKKKKKTMAKYENPALSSTKNWVIILSFLYNFCLLFDIHYNI